MLNRRSRCSLRGYEFELALRVRLEAPTFGGLRCVCREHLPYQQPARSKSYPVFQQKNLLRVKLLDILQSRQQPREVFLRGVVKQNIADA